MFFNGNWASSLKLFGQLELYNNSSFILIWQKKYGCYRQFLCPISWKLKKTFSFETTSPNDLLLSTNVCNHLYRDSSFSFDPVMEMEMSNSCHRNLCTYLNQNSAWITRWASSSNLEKVVRPFKTILMFSVIINENKSQKLYMLVCNKYILYISLKKNTPNKFVLLEQFYSMININLFY
jgi:hypothetical protein